MALIVTVPASFFQSLHFKRPAGAFLSRESFHYASTTINSGCASHQLGVILGLEATRADGSMQTHVCLRNQGSTTHLEVLGLLPCVEQHPFEKFKMH